jgi:enoyl-CoA hydratase/carnithine racemase
VSALDTLRGLAEASPYAAGRVSLRIEGATAWLELDNPRARNAMTLRMMVQLADAVQTLRAFPGSAVVVHGRGDAFCAGGHLAEVRTTLTTAHGARAMSEVMTATVAALRDLPCVVVAAVDGVAMGGGAELAVACDRLVLGPTGRVHFVHSALGVAPGWGGAAWLESHVGRSGALDILLQATPLDGHALAARGLPAEVAPHGALAGVRLTVEALADRSVQAVRALKAQVVAARPLLDGAPQTEAFLRVWGAERHRQALADSPVGRGEVD